MAIPYGRQSINETDIAAVTEVLSGDWLTTGPYVDAFEKEIAQIAGSPLPAVSVTSGTAALHAAYAGMSLEPGDEVVTTPMTFVVTASMAAIQGATPVFADICTDTGNIDPEAVSAAVTSKTKAIAGVDYAGHPIDAPALQQIAKQAGAFLLEDAAHSIGGFLNGQPVGSLADITTFSFFPTKNLTTAEGGAIVSAHKELLTSVRRFKSIGYVREPELLRHPDEGAWWYEIHDMGVNYRLPDVLAALGSSQLQRLTAFKERRQAIKDRYDAAFSQFDELRIPGQRPEAEPVWHLYPLRILDGRRRQLFEHLRAHDFLVQVNYIPVHWHPFFEKYGYKRGMCPVAETFYEQEISLPMYPDLTDSQVDAVIACVADFL